MSIYDEVRAERDRAHAKHGDKSMESWAADDYARLAILTEEVGEVAREFNEAEIHGGNLDQPALRAELVQVAAMATAWADACVRHYCGHVERTPGCGGCDPGAIEYVIEDGGTPRPFDAARDLRTPVSPPLYLYAAAVAVVRILDSVHTGRAEEEAVRVVWRALTGTPDADEADALARMIAAQGRALVAYVPPL